MLARGVLVGVVMFAFPSLVFAQQAPRVDEPAKPERPWYVGVSEAQRAEAQTLLERGNALWVERRYADALDVYRKAVGVWNHPSFHLNIVRCLIELDRPVEAASEIELALVYGPDALEEGLYDAALTYRGLLRKQVGSLALSCQTPGVALVLDSESVGSCPVTKALSVHQGDHLVIASKQGYLTETRKVTVVGGTRVDVVLSPIPLAEAGVEVRRWSPIVPWSVVAGGAALAGVGVLLRVQATSDMATYDSQVRQNCHTTGCPATMVDTNLRERALDENKAAIVVGSVGAAALIVGGVLVYLDRAQTVYPTVDATSNGGALGLRGSW